MDEIVNKVANSGLITIDLGDHYPEGSRSIIDLKDQLWQGMVIREKDFREWVNTEDWSRLQDHHVALFCSTDAIIPTWAYMLLSSALSPFARSIHFGDAQSLEAELWRASLASVQAEDYLDQRVIIKGCSDRPVSPHAFVELTNKLRPYVKSLMYGEPCSTVPVYKKPRG